jgi:tripartite-type tricarboxylate transporter receptor subunit TctC
MGVMRTKGSLCVGLCFAAMVLVALPPRHAAGDEVAKFYEGKQVRILIGADPGGPYDSYGRLLGRHLGRHIPGSPLVIVQNMPGATGVIAANYIYNRAQQDGTVIGSLTNMIPLIKVFGEVDSQFDPARFNWIGNLARELYTVSVRAASPVQTLDDAKRMKVTMGATAPSAMSSLFPRILNKVAGTQFQIVSGYAGLAAVEIAVERGEVDGFAGDSWYNGHGQGMSFNWYRDGTLRTIALVGLKRPPDFADVPLLIDLAQDADTRQLLELFSSPAEIGKPVVVGPDVPAERVTALRQGFDATMADPAFLADASKLSLAIEPISGEQLTVTVKRLMAVPDAVVRRARDAVRR